MRPWTKGWPESWLQWAQSLKRVDHKTWKAHIKSSNHKGEFIWEVKIGDASDVDLDNYSFDYIWQDAFSPKKKSRIMV